MLRDYQIKAINDCNKAWQTNRNVMLSLPTGAGKTYTFSHIIKDFPLPTIAVAHRQELVSQMSLSLGAMGIPHNILASDSVLTEICKAHRISLGKVMFDPAAPTLCASVDTMIRRDERQFKEYRQWIMDEGHHVLRENKWGRAIDMLPSDARGLAVTATPIRADGKGLGSKSDGLMDVLVEGPTGEQLIQQGYLSPYTCSIIKVEDLDFEDVKVGKTGDFVPNQLRTATKSSRQLVGSIVDTYARNSKGRRGITFCVDIEHAEQTTYQYQQKGVKAALVTGKTGTVQRVALLEKFRRGEIEQLVNVDLFGEGFDVPAVEVVSMGRRTESFSLFSQQFGRALRPVYADGYDLSTAESRKAAIAAGPKPYAHIYDHVGNIVPRHMFPTVKKFFDLNPLNDKRGPSIPAEERHVGCDNVLCNKPYPAYMTACPHCGHAPKVEARGAATVNEVKGDLVLLDPDAIQELIAESNRLMQPAQPSLSMSRPAMMGLLKKHASRMEAQESLRNSMTLWAGHRKVEGLSTRESQKLFYLKYGVDVLTAQTLSAKEALVLEQQIKEGITNGH